MKLPDEIIIMAYKMFAVLVALSTITASVLSGCRHESSREERAEEIIATIKASTNIDVQGDKAKSLFDTLNGETCDKMSNETITQIISLLDIRHAGVWYWTARILHRLGSCAKPAIPKLKRLVPHADCWPRGWTAALEIRAALKKLGEPPIPKTVCTGYGEGQPKSQLQ
jgi:hypothetical protein